MTDANFRIFLFKMTSFQITYSKRNFWKIASWRFVHFLYRIGNTRNTKLFCHITNIFFAWSKIVYCNFLKCLPVLLHNFPTSPYWAIFLFCVWYFSSFSTTNTFKKFPFVKTYSTHNWKETSSFVTTSCLLLSVLPTLVNFDFSK